MAILWLQSLSFCSESAKQHDLLTKKKKETLVKVRACFNLKGSCDNSIVSL